MKDERLKYIKIAKDLNEKFKAELVKKKLHFRGNLGSFSLISLDRKTPEQGKSRFTNEKLLNMNKDQMDKFWSKIDNILARKREKIARKESRPTREKELQAWIINYAINNNYKLPFSSGLKFLTSELAFQTYKKIVNDILAIDQEGSLVVIELKSARHKQELMGQVDDFCGVIAVEEEFFKELVELLEEEREWSGEIRRMIVWPDANGKPRNDWASVGIEEVRYKEKKGKDGLQEIDYDENNNIVFL